MQPSTQIPFDSIKKGVNRSSRFSQHGPDGRKFGGLVEFLHFKALPFVEPHVFRPMRLEITKRPFLVGSVEHRLQDGAADPLPLVRWVDAQRRQEPMGFGDVFMVQAASAGVDRNQPPEGGPAEGEGQSDETGANFPRQRREIDARRQPGRDALDMFAGIDLAIRKRVAQDGAVKGEHAATAAGGVRIGENHRRVIEKRAGQHLLGGRNLALLQPMNLSVPLLIIAAKKYLMPYLLFVNHDSIGRSCVAVTKQRRRGGRDRPAVAGVATTRF